MSELRHLDSDDRLHIRQGALRQRRDAFVTRVLGQPRRQAANASGGRRGKVQGSRLGRGHVAARFTDNRCPVIRGGSPSRFD